MQKKKRLFILFIFCTLLLIVWRYQMIVSDQTGDRPIAVNGLLDLRNWNFDQQGTVKLAGDWEYYPTEQLDPSKIPATDPSIVHVPIKKNNEYAAGTYRLQILLKPPDQLMGLRIKNNAAQTIYVNQERLIDQRVPYLFQAHHRITILIQIEQMAEDKAANWLPQLKLGLERQILNDQFDSALKEILIIGFFVMTGIGLMLLYVILRKNSELLSAGLLLFFSGLFMLMKTDLILYRWMFDLSFERQIQLRELMQTLVICFYLIFIIHVMPTMKEKPIVIGAAGVIAIYGMLNLFARIPVLYKLELPVILLFISIHLFILIKLNIESYFYLYIGITLIMILSVERIGGLIGWLDRDQTSFRGQWIALVFILLFTLKRLYRKFLKQERQFIRLIESDKIKNQFLSSISLELHAAYAASTASYEISAAQEKAAASAIQDYPSAHIIVVEENPAACENPVQLLSSDSYRVTVMYSENEVQTELNRQSNWNMIIINTVLLTSSHFGFIRRLRTRYTLFELPILILCSIDHSQKIIEAFRAGANDIIFKPLDEHDFRQRVRMLLLMQSSVFERIRLERAVLRAKIEPHFLFNTLNTIASLSDVSIKQTRELLIEFGNFLRASFDTKNMDSFISFHKELGLVQSYLFIEKMRHADRLQIHMDIEQNLHFMIPPLTIQPIVENAIRHGIMKKIEGGTIHIQVKTEQKHIMISIKDNGIGMSEATIQSILHGRNQGGIGLVSTDRRLQHYFGIGLSIRSQPHQGTEVLIRIPKNQAFDAKYSP